MLELNVVCCYLPKSHIFQSISFFFFDFLSTSFSLYLVFFSVSFSFLFTYISLIHEGISILLIFPSHLHNAYVISFIQNENLYYNDFFPFCNFYLIISSRRNFKFPSTSFWFHFLDFWIVRRIRLSFIFSFVWDFDVFSTIINYMYMWILNLSAFNGHSSSTNNNSSHVRLIYRTLNTKMNKIAKLDWRWNILCAIKLLKKTETKLFVDEVQAGYLFLIYYKSLHFICKKISILAELPWLCMYITTGNAVLWLFSYSEMNWLQMTFMQTKIAWQKCKKNAIRNKLPFLMYRIFFFTVADNEITNENIFICIYVYNIVTL